MCAMHWGLWIKLTKLIDRGVYTVDTHIFATVDVAALEAFNMTTNFQSDIVYFKRKYSVWWNFRTINSLMIPVSNDAQAVAHKHILYYWTYCTNFIKLRMVEVFGKLSHWYIFRMDLVICKRVDILVLKVLLYLFIVGDIRTYHGKLQWQLCAGK